MEDYHRLFNLSYQRAITPDFEGFFKHFYDKLINAEPQIAILFSDTDMDIQAKILMQSMTHITSFAATMEANEEINKMAIFHGKDNLNISAKFFDVWLECLVDTVVDYDQEFDTQVERAWRVIMSPGLEYMKSFCR